MVNIFQMQDKLSGIADYKEQSYSPSVKRCVHRPFLEDSCTRVPKRSRNFVCTSDRSGKDSQTPFIPWKSELR